MLKAWLAASVALFVAGTAHAQVLEAGDAGQTLGSAQDTTGGTGTAITSIAGEITDADDVDLYKIYIAAPGNFSASTVNSVTGANFDTKLFLFDVTGHAIASNDDSSGTSIAAALPMGNSLYASLAAGTYFLGISNGSLEASNGAPANQDLFVQETAGNTTSVRGRASGVNPDTLGGWIPVNTGFDDIGAYRINLTGVTAGRAAAGAVPEPASWAMMIAGFALTGTALRTRRRKTACAA